MSVFGICSGIISHVFRAGTWLNDSVYSGFDRGRTLGSFVNDRVLRGLGQGRAINVLDQVLSNLAFGLREWSGQYLSLTTTCSLRYTSVRFELLSGGTLV